jgi:predicted dehydrogenase
MKELGLAIVGCGDIASFVGFLARLTPGLTLIAACDISADRVEPFARKHKISRVFTNYQEMLAEIQKDGQTSAVYLAVPHNLHFEMIKEAIDTGLHVFTEKPITRTLSEGREIVAYAQKQAVKIGVNYQYRYDSGCHRLARAVQKGALGKAMYARINLPWHREPGYFDQSPWHKTIAQAGGGTLITQASHLIDIVLWAVGSAPKSAAGYTAKKIFTDVEVEDTALGTIELQNGTLVQVCSSMAAASEQPVSIEIYGSKGTGIYTNHPWPGVKFVGVKPKVEKPSYWGLHALHRSLKGFRDWILHDQPFLIPGETALPALAAVEAIYQSAKEGRRILIPPSHTKDGHEK